MFGNEIEKLSLENQIIAMRSNCNAGKALYEHFQNIIKCKYSKAYMYEKVDTHIEEDTGYQYDVPTESGWKTERIRSWDAQNNATLEVAELMRDIGDAVGMNYACGESGAYVSNARNALVNTFGYSSSASYVDYNLNTALSELNSNRLIIMYGYHTKYTIGWWIFSRTNYRDGHAWVCDGYRFTYFNVEYSDGSRGGRGSGYFLHMNWG